LDVFTPMSVVFGVQSSSIALSHYCL
jgi:hypothetical protein